MEAEGVVTWVGKGEHMAILYSYFLPSLILVYQVGDAFMLFPLPPPQYIIVISIRLIIQLHDRDFFLNK